jgi:LmbE family N-acetylglucosaminyl deacetylase
VIGQHGSETALAGSMLVVAAHPDDEVLGCGGVMAAESRRRDVHILILGEGLTSRRIPSPTGARELEALKDQARAAAHIVGAASVDFSGLRDNRFDGVPLLDVVHIVEDSIAKWAPVVIYTHHPGDLNIDHAITARAVVTATRPTPGCGVKQLLTFECASSTEWAFQAPDPFRPNVFVDVSKTIETKLEALRAYASEVREFPHPRSPQGLVAIAQRWGSVCGVAYAEAFQLMRAIP